MFENNSATVMYLVSAEHRYLRIAINENLERIHFGPGWSNTYWDTVILQGNPKLKLSSTLTFHSDSQNSTAIGRKNTTSSMWV